MPDPRPTERPSLGLWVLAGLNGVGPGLALWALASSDRGDWLLHNHGTAPRSFALGWALASLLVVMGLSAWAWRKRGLEGLRCLHRILAPGAASLALATLYAPEVERSRTLMVYLLIVVLAYAVGVSVSQLRRATARVRVRADVGRLSVLRSRWLPRLVLAVGIIVHAAMMVRLGIVRHQALGSRIFDLGIFDNLLHHAAAGRWQVTSVLKGGRFTSAHCSPLLQVLGPLYRVWPGPQTLIAFQAVWLALGAIPLFLLAEHAFRNHPARSVVGLVFGLAWLCNPSLHGVTLFDFHALSLAAPLMVWAIYALHTERRAVFWISLGLLLLTREDLPLYCLGMGLYAFARGDRKAAAIVVVASLAMLGVYRLVWMNHPAIFMPDTEQTYRYANRFKEVIPDPENGGMKDVAMTVATNPGFVIQHALTKAKLRFACGLLVPTLGLALRGGRALWPASFGLTFAVLGSGSNLANLYLHYTVFLFPPLLCAAVFGLRNTVGPREEGPAEVDAKMAGWCAALMLTSVLVADKVGALRNSTAFYAGPLPLTRELDEQQRAIYAWVEQARAEIEPDATVAATNALGPHVSSRDWLFNFRHVKEADYLLLDLQNVTEADHVDLAARVRRGEIEAVSRFEERFVLYRAVAGTGE